MLRSDRALGAWVPRFPAETRRGRQGARCDEVRQLQRNAEQICSARNAELLRICSARKIREEFARRGKPRRGYNCRAKRAPSTHKPWPRRPPLGLEIVALCVPCRQRRRLRSCHPTDHPSRKQRLSQIVAPWGLSCRPGSLCVTSASACHGCPGSYLRGSGRNRNWSLAPAETPDQECVSVQQRRVL